MKHKTPKLNKILATLVAACLVAGLLPVVPLTASANPGGGGNGSESNPFLINNLAQLQTFRNNVNSGTNYSGLHIKLTAHIELSGNWTPIGNATNIFQGNFDGDG